MTYVEWDPEKMGPCPESDADFYDDDDDDQWFRDAVAALPGGDDGGPQQHGEPIRRSGIPLKISRLTVTQGGYKVDIPLQDLSGRDPLDMSDITDVEPAWAQEELLRFAEWFGYNIEPNPASSLGYRVTSPSGKVLGGSIASQVIEAWQKNPTGEKGGDKKKGGKGGGKGGAGGGAAKVDPAQKKAEAEAKKAATAAEHLKNAQDDAHFAIDGIDPEDMADRSKGKLNAGDLKDIIKEAKYAVDDAKTPGEARDAVKLMRRVISDYKTQMTKPPTPETALNGTKGKLKQNLPDATALAGTSFDPSAIQAIIDKHIKAIDTAPDAAGAQQAIKDMRTEIAKYKIDAAKEKAAAAKEKADARTAQAAQMKADRAAQAAAKKQATRSGQGGQGAAAPAPLPKTASEWADYYADAFVTGDPEQFGGPGSGRYPRGSGNDPKPRGPAAGGGESAPAQELTGLDKMRADIEAAFAKADGRATPTEFGNSVTQNEPFHKALEAKTAPMAQAAMMDAYFGNNSSRAVNHLLRHGTMDPDSNFSRERIEADTAKIQNAFKSAPALPEAVTAHRGGRVSAAVAEQFVAGAILRDKGVVSTSTSKLIADDFSKRKSWGGTGAEVRLMTEVRLPKGTRVMSNHREAELALAPGSAFKIISVKRSASVTRVVMEYVNE